ncbi:MAG: hypothetical protein Q9183_002559 [Haloplaca sp. 2 TL-2023]
MDNQLNYQWHAFEGGPNPENSSTQANAEDDSNAIMGKCDSFPSIKKKETDQAIGPFGLPHELIARVIREPYDASWILKFNVDAASIRVGNKQSNMLRFKDLFGAGALHIGDDIYHVGSYEMNGQTAEFEKVARVVGRPKNPADPAGTKYPSLAILSCGFHVRDLPFCRGPKEIAIAFNQILPQEPAALKEIGSWKQLRVRRGDTEFGSIHDVRNALFAWRQEMDVWASAHGISYRMRKPKRPKPAASQYAPQDGNEDGVGQNAMPGNQANYHQQTANFQHYHPQTANFQHYHPQTVNFQHYQQAAPEAVYADYCRSCGQAMPRTIFHSLGPHSQMRTSETSQEHHYYPPQAITTGGYFAQNQGLSDPSNSKPVPEDSFLGQLYDAI